MLRALVVATTAALALPAAAQASVKITWPRPATVEAGTKVKVKIRSDRPVRVALVRESASGRIMRTLARRTLRTGTFTVAVPVGGHALRVTSGKRHSQHAIRGVYSHCVAATAQTTKLRLSATSVQRGGTLAYDLVNTGDRCVYTGFAYTFQRQAADGAWAPGPLPPPVPLIQVIVGPNEALAKSATVPADAEPGHYRLVDVGVAAEFDVTP
jgi:hypothetical protein